MSQKISEFFHVLCTFILVFLIVWYFGFVNINPIDNFTNYNSGYLMLNGSIPFKDYWVTTGPLLDFLQFLLFKINGINWGSYVLHSAIINSVFNVYYIMF